MAEKSVKMIFNDHSVDRKVVDNVKNCRQKSGSLPYIYNRLTCCKKSEKSDDWKYENFCDGQPDRQTDGGNFKGPKVLVQ